MLLILASCVWVGKDAHEDRIDAIDRGLDAQLDQFETVWDRCAPTPIAFTISLDPAFVDTEVQAQVFLGETNLGTALGTTVLDGDRAVVDLSLDPDSYQSIAPSPEVHVSILAGGESVELVYGTADLLDEAVLFQDLDGDGVGSISPTGSCDPLGVESSNDCDDDDVTAFPAAVEICDLVDNNCDGAVDEGVEVEVFVDVDGDGYGAESSESELGCVGPGLADNADDCDDSVFGINPGVLSDGCDFVGDEDCDGLEDEDATELVYVDFDEDGFGAGIGVIGCPVVGSSTNADDCDDADPNTNPSAVDVTGNAVDEDCNGLFTCAEDGDADGFTAGTMEVQPEPGLECLPQSAEVDCNDSDPTVHPSGAELVGNTLDENCDGLIECFLDLDEDGFATDESAPIPVGSVCGLAPGTDCDDTNSDINEDADERCDHTDWDCSGGTLNGAVGIHREGIAYPTLAAAVADPFLDDLTLGVCGTVDSNAVLDVNSWSISFEPMVQASELQGSIHLRSFGNVSFTGLTLTGGTGTPVAGSGTRGGALYVEGTTTVTLVDARLEDSMATDGGCLYADRTTIFLDNVAVSGCEAANGGAIYLFDTILNLPDGPGITHNTASQAGGAIFASGSSTVQALGTDAVSFVNNAATQGSAVWLEDTSVLTTQSDSEIILVDNTLPTVSLADTATANVLVTVPDLAEVARFEYGTNFYSLANGTARVICGSGVCDSND